MVERRKIVLGGRQTNALPLCYGNDKTNFADLHCRPGGWQQGAGEIWREQKPRPLLASRWNLIWEQSVPSKVIHASEPTSTPALGKIRLSTYCLLATWHNLRCQVLTEKQLRQICDSLYISNMASDKKSLNLCKTFFFLFFFSPDVQYSRRYTFGNRDRSRDHRQSKESTAECQKEFYRCSREGPPSRHRIYIQTYIFNFHTYKKKQNKVNLTHCTVVI